MYGEKLKKDIIIIKAGNVNITYLFPSTNSGWETVGFLLENEEFLS